MSEFGNRIAAQRTILRIVNRAAWTEELFGLSHGAIERWRTASFLNPNDELVALVTRASERLFFLGNKSQEQITDEYKAIADDVARLAHEIERVMMNVSHVSA